MRGTLFAGLVTAALLSACATTQPVVEALPLNGTAWVLDSLGGEAPLSGHVPTLGFEGSRAAGSDGCNRYLAEWEAAGSKLAFTSGPAATMMACEPAVMAQSDAFRAALAAAILCLALPAAALASGRQARFAWNEANARMQAAGSKEDFARAAESYERLTHRGIVNGPLLYNLGTARLMAHNYEGAERALARAERYVGTTWEIRRNLTLATAHGSTDQPLGLPWYRLFLFWHYGPSATARLNIAVYAFAMLWALLTVRLFVSSATLRRLVVLTLVLAALFGSSVLVTVHQERQDRAEDHHRVQLQEEGP